MWCKPGQVQAPTGMNDGGVHTFPEFDIQSQGGFSGNGLFWFNYLSFGGTGLQVASGQFNASGSSQSITGVGFQPKCVIFFGVKDGQAGANGSASPFFGTATGSAAAEQWTTGMHRDYLTSLSNAYLRRSFYEGSCIWQLPSVGGSGQISEIRGTLSSFDADGFTLAWVGGNTTLFGWMAFSHPTSSFKAGIETENTVNGVKSTALGFSPRTVVFGSHGSVTTGGAVEHANIMFGCAGAPDGITAPDQIVASNLWSNVDDAYPSYQYLADDRCIQIHEWTGSAWTDRGSATCAMTGTGFNLNWSSVDGAARKFGYLAFEGGSTWNGDTADAWLFFQTAGTQTRGLASNNPVQISIGAQVGTGFGNIRLAYYRQPNSNGGASGSSIHRWSNFASVGFMQNAGGILEDWKGYVSGVYPLSGGSAVSFDKVVFAQ